jgi:Tfp pilus assembly protein PilV
MALSGTVCPNCKLHQSRLRSGLIFFAGLTGFAAFLASAVSYTAGAVYDLYRQTFWSDTLNLLYINTTISGGLQAGIANTGYGPIVVSGVVFDLWGGGSESTALNQKIDVNEIAMIDRKGEVDFSQYSGIIHNQTGEANNTILENSSIILSSNDSKSCFAAVIIENDSDILKQTNQYYSKINHKTITKTIKGTLYYYSVHSNLKRSYEFSALVVFDASSQQNCSKLVID